MGYTAKPKKQIKSKTKPKNPFASTFQNIGVNTVIKFRKKRLYLHPKITTN
jgi:hypothetical protein